MPNSLLTGISGLRGHQKMLEVVGNNLANLNTTAFKASRVLFADLIYHTQRGGTSSNDSIGSLNPIQIGTGSTVAMVDRDLSQGDLEASSSPLDMAINGNGFFVGMSGNSDYYTRAGSFTLDNDGYLSDSATGKFIRRIGTVGEPDGINPSFQTAGDNRVLIPMGASIPGKASQLISISGNLNRQATGEVAQTVSTSRPFLAGGVAATSTTLLNDLDSNTALYAPGDRIMIGGRRSDGAAPALTELAVTATTTIDDLITALNTAFPEATVSLDPSGNLVATDNSTGPSQLEISLADASGNAGGTDFEDHDLAITAVGKVAYSEARMVQVYDPGGTAHSLTLTVTKQTDGTWNLKATLPSGDGSLLDSDVEGITFADNGSLTGISGTGTGDTSLTIQFTGMASPQELQISFGDPGALNGLTQMGLATAFTPTADGYAPGQLNELRVDADGTIVGVGSNGVGIDLAQLAIVSFRNPDGLMAIGDNYFQTSLASGDAEYGTALSGSRGEVRSFQLEGSNVDLALEFTRLIVAQRGFSANARTITVTDEILQELTNLIR